MLGVRVKGLLSIDERTTRVLRSEIFAQWTPALLGLSPLLLSHSSHRGSRSSFNV